MIGVARFRYSGRKALTTTSSAVLTIEAHPAVLDLCWRHRQALMRDSSAARLELVHDGDLLLTATFGEALLPQFDGDSSRCP